MNQVRGFFSTMGVEDWKLYGGVSSSYITISYHQNWNPAPGPLDHRKPPIPFLVTFGKIWATVCRFFDASPSILGQILVFFDFKLVFRKICAVFWAILWIIFGQILFDFSSNFGHCSVKVQFLIYSYFKMTGNFAVKFQSIFDRIFLHLGQDYLFIF